MCLAGGFRGLAGGLFRWIWFHRVPAQGLRAEDTRQFGVLGKVEVGAIAKVGGVFMSPPFLLQTPPSIFRTFDRTARHAARGIFPKSPQIPLGTSVAKTRHVGRLIRFRAYRKTRSRHEKNWQTSDLGSDGRRVVVVLASHDGADFDGCRPGSAPGAGTSRRGVWDQRGGRRSFLVARCFTP